MAKLTKYEKETIVLFNEGEDTAHIQTYNPSATAIQRGTQKKSKRERQAKRVRKSDGIM